MIKTLVKVAALGIVGSRVAPALLVHTLSVGAGILTARILVVAALGLAPLLVANAAAVEGQRPRTLPGGLVPARTPVGAEARVEGYVPATELGSVHFDVNRAAIRPADREVLDANVEWLKAHPAHAVLLEGGADPRGRTDYNLDLAERRARAVRDYLVSQGIAAERITAITAGDLKRACRETGEACWSLDRRVDFLVKGPARQAP